MPTIELTKAEVKEARDCLFIERENVEESLRHYGPGDRDHESYAKAKKLLDSILAKLAEAK